MDEKKVYRIDGHETVNDFTWDVLKDGYLIVDQWGENAQIARPCIVPVNMNFDAEYRRTKPLEYQGSGIPLFVEFGALDPYTMDYSAQLLAFVNKHGLLAEPSWDFAPYCHPRNTGTTPDRPLDFTVRDDTRVIQSPLSFVHRISNESRKLRYLMKLHDLVIHRDMLELEKMFDMKAQKYEHPLLGHQWDMPEEWIGQNVLSLARDVVTDYLSGCLQTCAFTMLIEKRGEYRIARRIPKSLIAAIWLQFMSYALQEDNGGVIVKCAMGHRCGHGVWGMYGPGSDWCKGRGEHEGQFYHRECKAAWEKARSRMADKIERQKKDERNAQRRAKRAAQKQKAPLSES